MSQHKRNVAGMHKAVREKRDEVAKHVTKIIDNLSHPNNPVSFSLIANIARVSKAWLYRHAELRKKIEMLRLQKAISPNYQSQDSNGSIVNTLKMRIKRLETENKELRQQLEIVYGELHSIKNKN